MRNNTDLATNTLTSRHQSDESLVKCVEEAFHAINIAGQHVWENGWIGTLHTVLPLRAICCTVAAGIHCTVVVYIWPMDNFFGLAYGWHGIGMGQTGRVVRVGVMPGRVPFALTLKNSQA